MSCHTIQINPQKMPADLIAVFKYLLEAVCLLTEDASLI